MGDGFRRFVIIVHVAPTTNPTMGVPYSTQCLFSYVPRYLALKTMGDACINLSMYHCVLSILVLLVLGRPFWCDRLQECFIYTAVSLRRVYFIVKFDVFTHSFLFYRRFLRARWSRTLILVRWCPWVLPRRGYLEDTAGAPSPNTSSEEPTRWLCKAVLNMLASPNRPTGPIPLY